VALLLLLFDVLSVGLGPGEGKGLIGEVRKRNGRRGEVRKKRG
jgi:hypothetical protein